MRDVTTLWFLNNGKDILVKTGPNGSTRAVSEIIARHTNTDIAGFALGRDLSVYNLVTLMSREIGRSCPYSLSCVGNFRVGIHEMQRCGS